MLESASGGPNHPYRPLSFLFPGACFRWTPACRYWLTILSIAGLIATQSSTVLAAKPVVLIPKHHLTPAELGIIINDADPLSQRIGRYYQEKRGIPDHNVIHVSFSTENITLTPEAFAPVKQQVDELTPDAVQAFALTWAKPVRVGCMSITMAFADHYDEAYCSTTPCGETKLNPYFNSDSKLPYQDYGLRLTMSIAAQSFEEAKALIDRGISADASKPKGTAYLVRTHDRKRSLRAAGYSLVDRILGNWLPVQIVRKKYLRNHDDVLFYFTGIKKVKHLDTLTFLPGAIADHLTSFGGLLTTSRQMSSLRWLEAGATGSYGTVVEPCAIAQKFPVPLIVIKHYLTGATLLEAYWKSVAWPGEGIFIGEPLANPFGGHRLEESGQGLILQTAALNPGVYHLLSAPSLVGPFQDEQTPFIVRFGQTRFLLGNNTMPVLKLVRKGESFLGPFDVLR